MADRRRRPHHSPRLTAETTTERGRALRDRHPTWGGRKLRRRLTDLGEAAPAASTITALLRRGGRLDPAVSGHPHAWQRFEAAAPNDLWQLDFKGHFALAAGRCHPLHVLDDHARFVVGLVACADERGGPVHDALTVIFRRYGLPWALLCDNGPPWGTLGAESRLTAVGAWLIRLGIQLVHGRPYHPQTQGKLERANRTLAADVVAIARYPDLPSCQRAFDTWRHSYNHERPHEALALATPVTRYAPSVRPFPETLPPLVSEEGDEVRTVHADGEISLRGCAVAVSKALVGQVVGVRPTTVDGVWEVRYAHPHVRTIDLRTAQA